jgi:hypothetical protein
MPMPLKARSPRQRLKRQWAGMSFASASRNRGSEDVRVLAIIVTELEFSNIERKVLFADFVEAPHNTTLDQRPEALDCLRVNRADDVLAFGVVNGRVRIFPVKFLVSLPLVGAEQADFVRDGFADKLGEVPDNRPN